MTYEKIDKCLDFAEGNKGKFTILMAKKPEFPENLLTGTTEKQHIIIEYVSQGYTTRQIADILKCTQPNIIEHLRQYRKGRMFYDEWCEFWQFSENVRKTPILMAFAGILLEEEMQKYQKKGIKTVGDYLHFAVTMKTSKFCNMLGEDKAEANHKTDLFKCIREMCYKELKMDIKE